MALVTTTSTQTEEQQNVNKKPNIIIRKLNNNLVLQTLEKEIGYFPKHLKLLLIANGFDNFLSISTLNENSIKEMEKFTREELVKLFGNDINTDMENFFDIYADCPQNFKISIGHRNTLLGLKNLIDQKGIEYLTSKLYDIESLMIANATTATTTSTTLLSTPTPTLGRKTVIPVKRMRIENKEEVEELYYNALRTVVKNWLQEKSSDYATPDFYPDIHIEILETGDVVSSVVCHVCYTSIKVYSQLLVNSYNRKWIISNFKKHFEKHFQNQYYNNNTLKEEINK